MGEAGFSDGAGDVSTRKPGIVRGTGQNAGRTVAVAGGGPAGLAAALAFARQGADVTLYERAAALRTDGAGIQITPNGARPLHALGLAADLAACGLRAEAVEPYDALSGRQLARLPLAADYRFLHRADLLDMLGRAGAAAGVRVVTGHTLQGHADADLTVAADGIRSGYRAAMGVRDGPAFAGQVAWRTILPDRGCHPNAARIWMAPGRHVVTYPLPGGALNVVAVAERAAWAAEGWSVPDDPGHLRAAFADGAPALRHLLCQARTVRLWGLFRRPVAKRWWRNGADGALVLIGDAAHPTLPFLAQGANLALEDAWVLARACDRDADVAAGLAAYQARRVPRVTRAIAAAEANARSYHLSGLGRRAAHAALAAAGRTAPGLLLRRLDWLYCHDVTRE